MRRAIFDDEHDDFRDAVKTFVAREVLPHHDRWREDRLVSRDMWLAAGRQGLLGISVPAEHGGAGTEDFRFNVVLTEELARAGLALASSVGIHTDVVAPYLSSARPRSSAIAGCPGSARARSSRRSG